MRLQRPPAEAGTYVCPRCHGLWFDHGKLKQALQVRISERANPRALSEANRTKLMCPDCAQALFERAFMPPSGVKINQCAQCAGTFVTGAELAKARQFLEPLRRRQRASGM
jgi:Zn-finger nucleic acid-binding protein